LILICSAQPNEGKTFSSVNLALSMATETEIEVVLVDADVAKPEVLSTLGLPGGPGLMDALANPTLDVEQMLIHTDIPNLSVLPAGLQTNNDTELLASERTGKLIDRLTCVGVGASCRAMPYRCAGRSNH
jgi:protein-tyrosine kinase